MVVRMLREDGTRLSDGLPLYCSHPECILAWNTSVLASLQRQKPMKFIIWLQWKERDGEFGARCCVHEGLRPLASDEVMLG